MSIWTDFVKEFAKREGTTYGCALSDPECSKEYRAMKAKMGPQPKVAKKDRGYEMMVGEPKMKKGRK